MNDNHFSPLSGLPTCWVSIQTRFAFGASSSAGQSASASATVTGTAARR